MKLNVGCGPDADGDIRIDITRVYWLFGRTTANIIADAQHLPFRDKCFDELKAYHVLEHVSNWRKALLEWCRVSESLDIVFPIDSYQPHTAWRFFFSLPYIPRLLVRLPAITREHFWQFKNRIRIVLAVIKKQGFDCQLSYVDMPILWLLAFSRIDKYLGWPFARLKKRMYYHIKAGACMEHESGKADHSKQLAASRHSSCF